MRMTLLWWRMFFPLEGKGISCSRLVPMLQAPVPMASRSKRWIHKRGCCSCSAAQKCLHLMHHLTTLRSQIADRTSAATIVQEMDGLPLALDQAGAFIEETQCSVSDYLQRYRQRQAVLLKRRGGSGKDHPEPVATTWSLSFERVEQLDPLAAELLRCCAFLAPDAIPEQMIIDGSRNWAPSCIPSPKTSCS